MASGGSLKRPMSSESRSYDFGSDELLFSHDEYTQPKDQSANAKRSDSTAKDLHENRVGRPWAKVYGQQEDFPREDVISAVEICMKKHVENLMRNLEEINGRLTQLELFCYKLERSVGEFRTDMIHNQSEANTKLESLEKHVHEVQRSVQIIRDKQDLTDAHMELTKLHLSQKETVNSSLLSQRNKGDVTPAISDAKFQNDNEDMSNLQLTLSLPNQISSSHSIKTTDQNLPHKELPVQQPAPAQDRYIQNHPSTYYNTQHQPPPPPPPLEQHIQRLQPEQQHYALQRAQMQNLSHQPPPTQQQPPFSPYQQQWSQPMLRQQPSSQSQVPRPQTPPTYPPYNPYQPSITESFQSSNMLPPAPYSSTLQSIGYGVSGSSISHPLPQHTMLRHPPPPSSSSPPLVKSSHIGSIPCPPKSNMQAYNPVFTVDGSRAPHPQNYHTNMSMPASPMMRNHPYGEMIEKAVNMGYSRDHVVSVVKLMGETGQPLDFNALLDELNKHANGGPPRAWSR